MTALDAPEKRRAMEWRLSAYSDAAGRARDLTGFTREQIVADVLEHLRLWRMG
jgi:choline/glycine/proline betaine transport protein